MGINSEHCSHRAAITPKLNTLQILYLHINRCCQSFYMIMINESREEKLSCAVRVKLWLLHSVRHYQRSSRILKKKKKRNKIDSDLCLHTLIHSTFYCSCQNLEIVQIQGIALHGWLVKLESQTLTVGLPRSFWPLQITLEVLGQFYTVLVRIS